MTNRSIFRAVSHAARGATADEDGGQSAGLPHESILSVAIVLIAALVRLAYALMPRVVRWDEAGHLLVASNLVAGRGYSELAGSLDVHLPPFLPLASAALLELGLSPAWATATIHIVTGALLCLPIYALGRAIYGRRVGFIAAILVAVYPALAAWPFVWSTMTESPFLLFVFSGVWAAGKALQIADCRLRNGMTAGINPKSEMVRSHRLLLRPLLLDPPGGADLFRGDRVVHGGLASASAHVLAAGDDCEAGADGRRLRAGDGPLPGLSPPRHRPLDAER
ncbi:MAG: glycosyltransferase family 39 protein [Chloroflexi bacterium]|nr:glycosyltransferase family 39 protein [Chloroflexota bacterium]